VVESGALLKRCTPKGYPGFESLPHRCFDPERLTEPALQIDRLPGRWRQLHPCGLLEDPAQLLEVFPGRFQGRSRCLQFVEHLLQFLRTHPVSVQTNTIRVKLNAAGSCQTLPDLAVEVERRKSEGQVPKFLIEQIATLISALDPNLDRL
jgi:hypothetical protein